MINLSFVRRRNLRRFIHLVDRLVRNGLVGMFSRLEDTWPIRRIRRCVNIVSMKMAINMYFPMGWADLGCVGECVLCSSLERLWHFHVCSLVRLIVVGISFSILLWCL